MSMLPSRWPILRSVASLWSSRFSAYLSVQTKLEAQYNAKRDAHLGEVQDLKQQVELKAQEVRTLGGTIESLKGVNEELKAGSTLLRRRFIAYMANSALSP